MCPTVTLVCHQNFRYFLITIFPNVSTAIDVNHDDRHRAATAIIEERHCTQSIKNINQDCFVAKFIIYLDDIDGREDSSPLEADNPSGEEDNAPLEVDKHFFVVDTDNNLWEVGSHSFDEHNNLLMVGSHFLEDNGLYEDFPVHHYYSFFEDERNNVGFRHKMEEDLIVFGMAFDLMTFDLYFVGYLK